MVAAAYLHDVIEDTQVTLELIVQEFGPQIANLVLWLTKVSGPEDGNRAARKELDRQYLAQAPAEAQTVKLADLIANTHSIVAHDPAFAEVYLKEKLALLKVLTKGDHGLWVRAYNICQASLNGGT
jgi:(p)ppGpp synthase/HD superfamily hydrolase